MKKDSKFFAKFKSNVDYLRSVLSDVASCRCSVERVDFKVSHDLVKSIMTVSSQSCTNIKDDTEFDIFLNCVACEITRLSLRNTTQSLVKYNPRNKSLSINLIVYV